MLDVVRVDWPAPAQVRAVQTCRSGGVSRAPYDSLNLADHVGDAPADVAENRRRLRDRLRLPAEPLWLQQVHGRDVVRLPVGGSAPEADASWTSQAGIVCAVLTADCLPVLFCADDGSAVAAAHAGWRGLAAGVLEATVAAMPVAAHRLHAWLGPAIGPQAFEVGAEVRSRFVDANPGLACCFVPGRGRDRWFADLYDLARLRLRDAGVQSVHGGGACTFRERATYYSYRRDGACGRMASLVWIDNA